MTVSFITILLILFAGLRGGDADYETYSAAYKSVGLGYYDIRDVGFNVILIILNQISSDPVLMFLVIATLSVGMNINSFYKYSPYVFICVLLYFVHNYALKDMIQIRAGLSSALCLYSIRYLSINKRRFILMWLIALTIHISSILFVAVYFIYNINPSRKFIICALVLSLIIGTIYPLGNIIKSMTAIGEYNDRVAAYTLYGDSGFAAEIGIWSNINTVKSLIITLALLIFYNDLVRIPYFREMFLSYVIGLCWLICFNDFSIIGSRISNILMSVEPVLLTVPYALFSSRSRIIYTIILIIYAICVFNFNIAPNKIMPYNII